VLQIIGRIFLNQEGFYFLLKFSRTNVIGKNILSDSTELTECELVLMKLFVNVLLHGLIEPEATSLNIGSPFQVL
jgi:hypothetical protein